MSEERAGRELWNLPLEDLAARMFNQYETGPGQQKMAAILQAKAAYQAAKETRRLVIATWALCIFTIIAALIAAAAVYLSQSRTYPVYQETSRQSLEVVRQFRDDGSGGA